MISFGSILEAALLLGKVEEGVDDELTLKEARQAFAASQQETSFSNNNGVEDRVSGDRHSDKLSYPEFLEALARIGAMKWEDPRFSILQKITNCMKAVANITLEGERQ